MSEAEQMTGVARVRADKAIDAALGELHAAAFKIGAAHGIPEGIHGHSIDELLGRMAYVPSMARDLRRACGQNMAQIELNRMFDGTASIDDAKPEAKHRPPIEPSKIAANIPVGTDVGSLDGVSVQTIKALRENGINNIGDLVNVPDEHLVKMNGLGEKSVAHVRAAIAKAAAG